MSTECPERPVLGYIEIIVRGRSLFCSADAEEYPEGRRLPCKQSSSSGIALDANVQEAG